MPLDIHRELQESYVEPCTTEYGVEDVSIGIRYIDTCIGGIANHRRENHLRNAVKHIHAMRHWLRIRDDGLPIDFSLQELENFLRTDSDYALGDIRAAVETCYSEGYYPEPLECEDKIRRMKGIVELWNALDEKIREISYSSNVFAKTQSAAVGELAVLKLSTRKEIKRLKNTNQQQKDFIQVKNYTIIQQAEANKKKNATIQQQADIIQQQAEANKEKDDTIKQQAEANKEKDDTIKQQADTIERYKRLLEESGINLDVLSHL